MLFIGHFSFDELKGKKARHGYFTCIIDAGSREKAVAKFSDYILSLKKEEESFSGIEKVYIEDIIAVRNMPSEPIVTLFQSSEGNFPKSISISLPSVFKEGIDAFGLSRNVNRHEEANTRSYKIAEPFITF